MDCFSYKMAYKYHIPLIYDDTLKWCYNFIEYDLKWIQRMYTYNCFSDNTNITLTKTSAKI